MPALGIALRAAVAFPAWSPVPTTLVGHLSWKAGARATQEVQLARNGGILANSLMPGGIWTNLQRHWSAEFLSSQEEYARQNGIPMKSPEQGAATSALLAASPLVEGVGGRYFEDCNEAEVVPSIVDGVHGVREYALDPEAAERLWDVSLDLLG